MYQVAIIGGGASGVLAAIHILRAKKTATVTVDIFEPSAELGAGLAYGTTSPEHILNVPAEKMSCDEREPLDFVNWLKKNQPQVFTDKNYPFVSRQFYKSYLQTTLKDLGGDIQWIQKKAIRIQEQPQNRWRVWTSESESSAYHACIIATGYVPDTLIPRGLSVNDANVIADPYHAAIDVKSLSEVAIVGTGLTAIDIWRTLRKQNFSGVVHFLSRRGLFPKAFTIKKELQGSIKLENEESPLSLLHTMRKLQKQEGCDGGSIATHLRPQVPKIWKSWSARHKKQFLSHMRPYWDSIRHRLPDEVHKDLYAELESKKSFLYRARDLTMESAGTKSRLNFSGGRSVVVDRIFVATGARLDSRPLQWDTSALSVCPFGLGLESKVENLYVVGPASRTTSWEVSAVPEIRVQAQSVAEAIVRLFA